MWLGCLDSERGEQLLAEGDECGVDHRARSGEVDRNVLGDVPVAQDESTIGEQDGLLDVVGDE